MSIRILDPVVDSPATYVPLAPRLDTLDGKVIGLYNNGKLNSAEVLEMVAEMISERFKVREFVRVSYPIPGTMSDALHWKQPIDAGITTIGD